MITELLDQIEKRYTITYLLDGNKFLVVEEIQRLIQACKIINEALENWIKWEDQQIEKVGPYVGKEINELIKKGKKSLEECARILK